MGLSDLRRYLADDSLNHVKSTPIDMVSLHYVTELSGHGRLRSADRVSVAS